MNKHQFKPGSAIDQRCREMINGEPCGLGRGNFYHDFVNRNMTPEHEAHLAAIQKDFAEAVDKKYRAGTREHGGNLWSKPGLIEKAMEECIDQYVYLFTLKQQRDDPSLINPGAKDIDEMYECDEDRPCPDRVHDHKPRV